MAMLPDRCNQTAKPARILSSGKFKAQKHYYDKVLNAQIHPLLEQFFRLTNEQILSRYCHLYPEVQAQALREALNYKPEHFYWAGADLLHVTNLEGQRHMLLIESNSCPSGQKSMPLIDEKNEQGGYAELLAKTFKEVLPKHGLPEGALAVVYDKNPMENTGYAASLADVMKEDVYLVEFYDNDPDPSVRFQDGVMQVRDAGGYWQNIRAAFRYVTQRPWNRIPVTTKTFIFNPVVACLAGGRNKLVADKSYEVFNHEMIETGLKITAPETIRDVTMERIPFCVRKKGGHAVIKNPYSNAGQGVWTITSREELKDFVRHGHFYNQFIVQSLIGNAKWSSQTGVERFYHVGTVPNARGEIFAFDLRFMVASQKEGFRPVSIYARRARKPLSEDLDGATSSWDMLGTNLSFRHVDGAWDSDTDRLLLMDRKDFNILGLGLDDLIEAFIQTVLSVVAIDRMAKKLMVKGKFNLKAFKALNNDSVLIEEILV